VLVQCEAGCGLHEAVQDHDLKVSTKVGVICMQVDQTGSERKHIISVCNQCALSHGFAINKRVTHMQLERNQALQASAPSAMPGGPSVRRRARSVEPSSSRELWQSLTGRRTFPKCFLAAIV
jgi:hypothetical protein